MLLILTGCAVTAGIVLSALLTWTWVDERLQIWPSPGTWSWQSLLFWTLFRTLNVSSLTLAFLDWQPGLTDAPERLASGAIAAGCFVLYLLACHTLGRANLYCGKDGLVSEGIYRWTRNPQYATAIPAYLCLALASQSPLALTPILLVVACFALMALAEEPWLRRTYGEPYARYCQRVPRFYNWRRALDTVRRTLTRAQKALKELRSET
jgi:protein-S-isoprenylcysteine O-methyltransferase Ste14